jgi:hypothetical protein
MSLPDDQLPTIEEMIAELGAPRSYAEQALLRRMREWAEQSATAQAIIERGEPWQRDYQLLRQQSAWDGALATKHAIECFREHGRAAVIPGVFGVPKEGK